MRASLTRTVVLALACSFVCCGTQAQQPHAFTLSGDFPGTHDPSVAREGNRWYVFATGKAPDGGHMAIRCSSDLQEWHLCGHVFDKIPDWIHQSSPGTQELWAPDISWYKGTWRLYYAYSLFGRNTSGIALATNKTLDPHSPDYKWVDQGLVLRSTASDDFNAIDPNFAMDDHGRAWLSFGSFWSGIKMRELDPRTGKLLASNPQLYSLASRRRPANAAADAVKTAAPADASNNAGSDSNKPVLPPDWEAIEAPFIVHHGGYYYLFVSWDLCCRGLKSTYHTVVGRSHAITGPYVDESGTPMSSGGGTGFLTANARWLGPGGESILMHDSGPATNSKSGANTDDIIVFHAYDAHTGKPALQISTVTWENDWPHAALQQ